jgi:hypothetical protein
VLGRPRRVRVLGDSANVGEPADPGAISRCALRSLMEVVHATNFDNTRVANASTLTASVGATNCIDRHRRQCPPTACRTDRVEGPALPPGAAISTRSLARTARPAEFGTLAPAPSQGTSER